MRWISRRTICISLIGAGISVLAGYFLREPLFFTFLYSGTRADWEIQQIRDQHSRQTFQLADVRRSSATDAEVKAAEQSFDRWQDEARRRCLEIAAENPGTRAEASALLMVTGYWPKSVEGKCAHDKLLKSASTADIANWARG